MKKEKSLQQMVRGKLHILMQKNEVRHLFYIIHKIIQEKPRRGGAPGPSGLSPGHQFRKVPAAPSR